MHICIIGAGVSGWIASTILKNLNFIKKITIIGSPKIPSIGVGESTTMSFANEFLKYLDLKSFVRESDATVKYGVYYKDWSKKNFIHYFKSQRDFQRNFTVEGHYGKLLANKDSDVHIHDLIGSKLWNFIGKNEVSLDLREHIHSWHFDAGKFIEFLRKTNLKDPMISFIDDTIMDCEFLSTDEIEYIVGESGKKYFADYFVNCLGNSKLNEKIFNEKYISLSPYLLTNKAVVCPINFKNKKEQFHPYTVAKTMKNGWRWITPTQSRIGTGYVFSDNHISVDEATQELLGDIGDNTLNPFLVDFSPKYCENPFKYNNCNVGMSSGFLEPLDAPGLDITVTSLLELVDLLNSKKTMSKSIKFNDCLNKANDNIIFKYKWWCAFILNQYKTCWKNDTQFWIDHKNINYDYYDEVIDSIQNLTNDSPIDKEYMMFFLTLSGKDIRWKTTINQKPFIIEQLDTKTIHHLEYIQRFYE